MHLLICAHKIIWVSKGQRKIRLIELNHKSRPPNWSFSFLSRTILINFWSGQHSASSKRFLKQIESHCELTAASRLKSAAGFNEFQRLEIIIFFLWRLQSFARSCGCSYRKCDSALTRCLFWEKTRDETEQVGTSGSRPGKTVFVCSHGSKAGVTRLTCSSRKAEPYWNVMGGAKMPSMMDV